jgi:hypothetical protein
MTATGIPPMHLELAWPYLWPFLERAYGRSDEKPIPAEILASIRTNALQAWLIYDKNIAVAGICTKLIRDTTSGELHCHIWLIGGSRLLSWADDFLSKLIPWAKAEGCCAITTSSKRGWGRRPERFGFVRIEDRNDFPTWKRAI